MGLYVRKAQIEYRKLEFEEMCKFYNAFETYISAIGKDDQHSQSKDQSLGSGGSTVLSAFDMEKYLDQQTQRLSSKWAAWWSSGLLEDDMTLTCPFAYDRPRTGGYT